MTARGDLHTLARHGRSFRLAGRLLDAETLDKAASLYAVCRAIDDLADERDDEAASREALVVLRADLASGACETSLGARFGALGVDTEAAVGLVDAMLSDLGPRRIETEADLLRYAFGAAGTVGLMMCHVLHVTDPLAWRYAVDLGIAMQLTNIARDVAEDARRGRVYLPAAWLLPGVTADTLLDDADATWDAVRRLLDLAERFYRSGARGYGALPGRAALAIPVAARLYQEIGARILRTGPAYLHRGRCVVPVTRRLVLVASSLLARPGFARIDIPDDLARCRSFAGLPETVGAP